MKLQDTAAEIPFDAKIDARFPYDDPAEATALIAEGRSISLNADFCVLHEICRKPFSNAVTNVRQRELLAEWASGFEHDLKAPLFRCAAALIEGQDLPWPEAVAIMEKVGNFNAQRAALAIAYFAGDCDTVEGSDALEAARNRVVAAWEKMGV